MEGRLAVYVPVPGAKIRDEIDAGSGIVGSDGESGTVRIDFEGNRHGSPALLRYADRVHMAAVRHTWEGGKGYPTKGRRYVRPDEVLKVGTYDLRRGVVVIQDREAMEDWLGLNPADPEEFVISHGTTID